MSFELRSDESIKKAIRRIVNKLLESVVKELAGGRGQSRDEKVHDARKSFKKLRAVLRLIRPAIGARTYRAKNTLFRNLARPLTEVRDARILVDTLDKLIEHFKDHLSGRSFDGLRKVLEANRRAAVKQMLDKQHAFNKITPAVQKERKQLKDWIDVPNRWSSIGEGLEATYGQARDAFRCATIEQTTDTWHEWRKQTKYLLYQLRLLRPLWPERIGELADESDQLQDLLGNDHDLSVLAAKLNDDANLRPQPADVEFLAALIDRRRADLQAEAVLLGERFFAAAPCEFVDQLKAFWRAWRNIGEYAHSTIAAQ